MSWPFLAATCAKRRIRQCALPTVSDIDGVVEQFGGVPAFGLADHDFVTVLARSSTDTAVDAECLA